MSGYELSVRWVLHHGHIDASKGDAVNISASRPEQLEDTLQICERGPLPQNVVDEVSDVWRKFKESAPSYSPWVGVDGKPLIIDWSQK